MRKRAKILDEVPEYGSPEWRAYQYERAKEENRGHNYRYWNDEWWKEMESKGWQKYQFRDKQFYTKSEYSAKGVVSSFHDEGCFARIVCGYYKTKQREKFFTVIYKQKK
jgi:hypothetical protein